MGTRRVNIAYLRALDAQISRKIYGRKIARASFEMTRRFFGENFVLEMTRASKFIHRKNCESCPMSQKLPDSLKSSKIVKLLVMSCFIITLIKCLKGHSVMSNVKVSESVSE